MMTPMPKPAVFEPGTYAEPWHRMLEGFRGLDHRVLGVAARRRWAAHPYLADIQVRSCGHYRRASDHSWRRRGFTEGVLIYCTAGVGWYRRGKRTWPVAGGDLLWCPPGTSHAYGAEAVDPWSILWLHLQGSAVDFHAAMVGFTAEVPVIHLGVHPILVAALRETVALARPDPDEAAMMAVQASARRVFGLATALPRMRPLTGTSDRAVAEAQRILGENPELPLDLPTLARAVGLSPSHLSRSFRAATGEAPRRWLVHLRVRHACRMLSATSTTVAEVARRLGFSDQFHFSRCFRRCTGVSPRAWRDAGGRPASANG
jgi:AraC family transcriptional regulator of arabinose operon